MSPLRPVRGLLRLLRWVRRYVASFYAVAGIYLTAALALSLAGLWALVGLTAEVMEGETMRFDEGVLRWIDAYASAPLDRAALDVTALGDTLVVLVISVVAGTILLLLGRRADAALIAVAVVGAGTVNPALKLIFDRPRPQVFEWRADHAAFPSYPSGHATMSMVLFLVLAYVVSRLAGRRWVSIAALTTAGVLVALIGASRLYLGVHYPSDVVAGYLVGFAWATFCALGVEALPHLRGRPERRDDDRASRGRIQTSERGSAG